MKRYSLLKRSSLILFALLLTFLLNAQQTYRARAAAITVNTTSDVIADDGSCSLREAIIAANTNAASGLSLNECSAGGNGSTDTISLTNGATYSLTISGS